MWTSRPKHRLQASPLAMPGMVPALLALLMLPALAAMHPATAIAQASSQARTQASATPSQATSKAPALDPMRERIRRGDILSAGFDTRYTDGFTSETSSRSGRLWLADGAYRVETEDQILVVKGRVSTVFDHALNRVLISDYDPDEDDFAPSRFLEASEEMIERQSRSGLRTVVTLTSEDPFALWVEIRIVLDVRGLPITISGRDQGDNTIDTELGSVEWIAGAGQASLFSFTPPDGAEIIDLRESTGPAAGASSP